MPNLTSETNIPQSVTLHCQGRIVRGHETRLLCAVLRTKAREITLDMRDVSEIDAAGIGALVSLQASGIYLKLVNPRPTLRDVLRLTKLDSVFEVVDEPRGKPAAAEAPTELEETLVEVG
jgi:anti-anti-sigma factor